jgi:hypothetical protein
MNEGVDGLLRDKTRPGRIASLDHKIVAGIASGTLGKPPGGIHSSSCKFPSGTWLELEAA